MIAIKEIGCSDEATLPEARTDAPNRSPSVRRSMDASLTVKDLETAWPVPVTWGIHVDRRHEREGKLMA